MDERTQHHHRCADPSCEVSWTCYRSDCTDDLCDACEQRRFEDYATNHGWTETQPTLPEIVPALLASKE